ncbi:MAG TPA: TauD/TfdA family dioxygenase [Acidiferrobacterales bacterium]|nr:TauD/TfdA family dioxygenase [Acidiferrobacterales bacterium]
MNEANDTTAHKGPAADLKNSAIKILPLSPGIGAEIVGVDLSRELDAGTFERIRQAWYDYNILLFRGQRLAEEDQVRFAGRFGELAKLVNKNDGMTGHPAVMLVSNVKKDGKLIGALPDGEMYFHSDQCYVERPCAATMLYSIEIPSRGGNTLFANMYKAYDTLPEDMKRRISGRKAMNVYDYDRSATARPQGEIRTDAPSYAHPIVRTHPVTGRKALYVNRLMTQYILDIPRAESDEILKFLFDHQEQPQFVYEHVWTPGELIIWDNRCSLHARSDFDAGERRMLRRVIILGEKPF